MSAASSEQESKVAVPARTEWHRILGALFELLLTRLGILVQTELQVMSEPPKVDILLLRRQGEAWNAEQKALLCDGLRDSDAHHLLIEFKYTESFSEEALLQGLGYGYFYRTTQGLSEKEVELFVMVAKSPRKRLLEHLGYRATGLSGVYTSQQPLASKVKLIVLNQLQWSGHNAFVQCFSSQRKVYRNAFERIEETGTDQLNENLLALIAGLQNQRESKGETMKKQANEEAITAERLIQIGKETRRFVIASLTAEELATLPPAKRLAGLAPEDRLAGLAPEERLAGLAPEDRLAGLAPEDRLAGLAPEELAKLLEQVEAFLQRQSDSTGK